MEVYGMSASNSQAVKSQSSLTLPVIFMDGTRKVFEVDPATTCAELCQLIKEELGLKDIFGFSVFIEALNQVRRRNEAS